jgi:SAM-dependent methyltransferase
MEPSQNIYDDPAFFTNYVQLPRQQKGLLGAPEWPALRAMLGSVQGKDVLDLGCGMGWVCRWARDESAKMVKGVDLSETMIAKAREFDAATEGRVAAIDYVVQDLETWMVEPEQEWDVVFSSLTLHYLYDLRRLAQEIYSSLRSGGRFVFSVEHPIYTAPKNPAFVPTPGSPDSKTWQLNAYAEEGVRLTSWLGAKGVRKYHRTMETYLSVLLETGFVLRGFREWMPEAESVGGAKGWVGERDRPMFLLVGVEKAA